MGSVCIGLGPTLDVVLPLVGIGMPMQFADASGRKTDVS